MATPACARCGLLQPDLAAGCHWDDVWYCSRVCAHAAGDRSACSRGCGCTGYARKRRRLREHRVEMRIMEDIIVHNGLDDVLAVA
eukprot:1850718-Alexandrium_andersonii.AAC.1